MFGYRRKSALLIDFENLHVKCGGRRFVESVDRWMLWLEHGKFDPKGVRRKFLSKQVFWVPAFEKYRLEFLQRDFEVHMCRAIRKEKASSADFDLTIRAAELRHEHRDLKEIIILSFDSDFVSVLNHIQLQDIHGVGMVDPETKFAQAFRNIVDLTIEKPDFMRAMEYVPAKRGWFGLGKEKVAKTEAAKPKVAPAKPVVEQAAPAPATSDGRFNFPAAAAIVVKYAEENQLVYLGQELVRRLLIGQQGFVVGATHWATLSYKGFIEQLAEREPRLRVERKQQGKGVVLVFRTTTAT